MIVKLENNSIYNIHIDVSIGLKRKEVVRGASSYVELHNLPDEIDKITVSVS